MCCVLPENRAGWAVRVQIFFIFMLWFSLELLREGSSAKGVGFVTPESRSIRLFSEAQDFTPPPESREKAAEAWISFF